MIADFFQNLGLDNALNPVVVAVLTGAVLWVLKKGFDVCRTFFSASAEYLSEAGKKLNKLIEENKSEILLNSNSTGFIFPNKNLRLTTPESKHWFSVFTSVDGKVNSHCENVTHRFTRTDRRILKKKVKKLYKDFVAARQKAEFDNFLATL